MDNEPIISQDGSSKNDCERNAAKRLLEHMQSAYHKEWLVFVMDALYSCGPIIRQIRQNAKWQYVIGIKPDGNKPLFTQFEGRNHRGHVKWCEWEKDNSTHRFGYTNGLALNSSNSDVRVNMRYYEQLDKKGEKQTFSWVTGIRLTKANVEKVMRMGRARWNSVGCRIENETFNTLKNQGYDGDA